MYFVPVLRHKMGLSAQVRALQFFSEHLDFPHVRPGQGLERVYLILCYGSSVKCPPEAHVFTYLGPKPIALLWKVMGGDGA